MPAEPTEPGSKREFGQLRNTSGGRSLQEMDRAEVREGLLRHIKTVSGEKGGRFFSTSEGTKSQSGGSGGGSSVIRTDSHAKLS